ncbi:MAG: hypothetical protein ACREHV_00370, partial [Rhizomicrobium sp.]
VSLAAFCDAPAAAKGTAEVTLATQAQALTYCQSGKMPGGDIAYVNGTAGLAQYGPDSDCAQQVPAKKTKVTKAIEVVGTHVKECKLAKAKPAVQLCENGGVATWDIDYISGKVATVLSGPGYGCTVGITTGGIGNAICK